MNPFPSKSLFNSRRIQFNRNEISGSFGDIGTGFPLIVGMILAAHLNVTGVFVMFGLMQILTGILYGLPMPMQPLKAMAVLVISQQLPASVLFGAGIAVGAVMLILTLSGALTWIAHIVPRCVVRGIQFGLGLSLASLAVQKYIPAMGETGYVLAAIGLLIMLLLRGNRHWPAGLFVIGLGLLYAVFFKVDFHAFVSGIGFNVPAFYAPRMEDILTGFVVLALPQLPLSISNSVIATNQTVKDLFPERKMSVKKIGMTYGLINLIVPFFQGIPVCHGCGGLAGHYALGARTGGSVVMHGSIYVLIGLFFSGAFLQVIEFFPKPILGIVLLFEAFTLAGFIRDQMDRKIELIVALIVALIAFFAPQGYILGLMVGTVLYYSNLYFQKVRVKVSGD